MGQGTWQMAEGRRSDDEVAALRAGIARGLTHIDTAEMYGAARRRADRGGDPGHPATRPLHRQQGASRKTPATPARCAPASRACGAWAPTTSTSTCCTGAAASRWPRRWARWRSWSTRARSARSASRTSTSPIWRRRAALLRTHPIACNQVLYHLGERHIDAELVPYCAKHDIAVVGYSPFGHGRFPSPSSARGRVARRRRRPPRRHAPPGRARVPRPRAAAVHDPEGVDARARRGERRRARPRAHRRRPRRDRRRLPVRAGSELPVI